MDHLYSLLSQEEAQNKYKGQYEDVVVVRSGAIAVTGTIIVVIIIIIVITIVINIVINRWIWINKKDLKGVYEPNDDAQLYQQWFFILKGFFTLKT